MQLSDAASAIGLKKVPQNYFIYYGWMRDDDVPRDVTHVRIHSYIRAIKEAFYERRQLVTVILGDGLEEIGVDTFKGCKSLQEINIPNAVKRIKMKAF